MYKSSNFNWEYVKIKICEQNMFCRFDLGSGVGEVKSRVGFELGHKLLIVAELKLKEVLLSVKGERVHLTASSSLDL